MSTDAKRAGNARYLAKMKTLTIRVKPEEYAIIQDAASRTGDSVQGYFLRAVRDRMTREAATDGLAGENETEGAKREEEGGYGG